MSSLSQEDLDAGWDEIDTAGATALVRKAEPADTFQSTPPNSMTIETSAAPRESLVVPAMSKALYTESSDSERASAMPRAQGDLNVPLLDTPPIQRTDNFGMFQTLVPERTVMDSSEYSSSFGLPGLPAPHEPEALEDRSVQAPASNAGGNSSVAQIQEHVEATGERGQSTPPSSPAEGFPVSSPADPDSVAVLRPRRGVVEGPASEHHVLEVSEHRERGNTQPQGEQSGNRVRNDFGSSASSDRLVSNIARAQGRGLLIAIWSLAGLVGIATGVAIWQSMRSLPAEERTTRTQGNPVHKNAIAASPLVSALASGLEPSGGGETQPSADSPVASAKPGANDSVAALPMKSQSFSDAFVKHAATVNSSWAEVKKRNQRTDSNAARAAAAASSNADPLNVLDQLEKARKAKKQTSGQP